MAIRNKRPGSLAQLLSGGVPARRKLIRAAAAVTSLSLIALTAACSGSDDGDSGANADLKGAPYVIGNLTHQNTTYQQLPKSNTETTKAWEAWTNDHGGINGHPVKVVSYDTQSDNAKAIVFAKRLVEDSKVIALAGNNDPTSELAYQDYLTKLGIPVIGSTQSTIAYKNPNWFPTAPSDYAVLTKSVVAAAKAADVKKYGLIYCTESPLCKADVDQQVKAAQTAGLEVAANFSASLSAPNYTAECVKLKNAGVDGVYFSATAAAIAKLSTDCKKQGMEMSHFFLEPSPDLQQTPAVFQNGAYGIDKGLPYFAEEDANKNYREAMDEHASGVPLTADGAQMWAAMEVLKAALEKVPDDPMTPATVKKGLYALPKDFTTDGLTVPLNYTEGQPSEPSCVFLWSLDKGGKYKLTDGATPTCV